MDKDNNDRWLDELLSGTVNTTRPQFDAESWKQKYPEALEAIESLGQRGRSAVGPPRRRTIPYRLVAGLAAAVLVIAAIGIIVLTTPRQDGRETVSRSETSPARMITAMSLQLAFNQGGIEAVERQFEEACRRLGPRSASMSLPELLEDLNG